MISQYENLARFYDVLNDGADYDSYFDFIDSAARELVPHKGGEALSLFDLGCGTGELSLRFARAGYRVCAADLSEEMLTEASSKCMTLGNPVTFTHQDMRSFSVCAKQDVIISCFDCVNYLTVSDDVLHTFERVADALSDDGIFIFDINTPYKYRHVYGDNTFVLDHDNVYCIWQNDYHESSKMCYFELTFFAGQDGHIRRFDESQKQRCWSCEFIERKLAEAGLDIVRKCLDKDVLDFIEKESLKYYYIVRKKH